LLRSHFSHEVWMNWNSTGIKYKKTTRHVIALCKPKSIKVSSDCCGPDIDSIKFNQKKRSSGQVVIHWLCFVATEFPSIRQILRDLTLALLLLVMVLSSVFHVPVGIERGNSSVISYSGLLVLFHKTLYIND
jgi:hypothetical protein